MLIKQHKENSLFDISKVFKALADPVRRGIIKELLKDGRGAERLCSTFPMKVTKATRSHHFKILREAGLISLVDMGNCAMVTLRWREIESELPGLIELLLNSMASDA